jgi:uncharacterized metal-binding protein
MAGHIVGTLWLTPDLDQPSALGGGVGRRWGPLKSLWKPYELAIPHRSAWSHSGVSALVRLLYMFAHLYAVVIVAGIVTGYPAGRWLTQWIGQWPPGLLVGFACGCITADLVHTTADHTSTWVKRHTHWGKLWEQRRRAAYAERYGKTGENDV